MAGDSSYGGCLSWQVVNGKLSTETAPARSTGLLRCGIDAPSHHRHRIETPNAVGCIVSTATTWCDDDVGSPVRSHQSVSLSIALLSSCGGMILQIGLAKGRLTPRVPTARHVVLASDVALRSKVTFVVYLDGRSGWPRRQTMKCDRLVLDEASGSARGKIAA
jgi:hypothetical protein